MELLGFCLATMLIYLLFYFYKHPIYPENRIKSKTRTSKTSSSSKKANSNIQYAKQIKSQDDRRRMNIVAFGGAMGSIGLPKADSNRIIMATKRNGETKRERNQKKISSLMDIRNDLEKYQKRLKVIVGIDFTASNEWQGKMTFHKRSLHRISTKPNAKSNKKLNPYQRVLTLLGNTFQDYLGNNCIYTYGFGDAESRDFDVFNIAKEGPCFDFQQVLTHYNNTAKTIKLGGPTCFAPLIDTAIQHVRESNNEIHVLIILADGQMGDETPTLSALIDASFYPLYIIMIGVGDGPWEFMEDCNEWLPTERKFHNFQFINYNSIHEEETSFMQILFDLSILSDMPELFEQMADMGYYEKYPDIIEKDCDSLHSLSSSNSSSSICSEESVFCN